MTVDEINALIGVDDVMFAPIRLMETLLDPPARVDLFHRWLACDHHLETDQFQGYFEEEQAQRVTMKQDFTPRSVSQTLNRLVGYGQHSYKPYHTTLDVCAGTGGILINRWWNDCLNHQPMFHYRPSYYWYEAEELSDRAVPFLIFNMAIRGITGAVIHGDCLERTVKNVFFIQNFDDDFLHFSDVNVMPRTATVANAFSVREWVGDPILHIERVNDDLADLLANLLGVDDASC